MKLITMLFENHQILIPEIMEQLYIYEYLTIGMFTDILEKKGYKISVAYNGGKWKGDITTPEEKVISFEKEFKTSFQAREFLIIETQNIINKNKQ